MAVDKSTVSETSVSKELHKKNTESATVKDAAKLKEEEVKAVEANEKAHVEEAQPVKTSGDSPEEKAAKRAGINEERETGAEIDGQKNHQNRNPRNKFEKENQKVTDEVRRAAQKESDLSTEKREEKAEEPKAAAKNDAAKTAEVNHDSNIADAIIKGMQGISESGQKKDKFQFSSDRAVQHRFSVVRNKEGKVFIRENAVNVISPVQTESLEEKDAAVQSQEVEEL